MIHALMITLTWGTWRQLMRQQIYYQLMLQHPQHPQHPWSPHPLLWMILLTPARTKTVEGSVACIHRTFAQDRLDIKYGLFLLHFDGKQQDPYVCYWYACLVTSLGRALILCWSFLTTCESRLGLVWLFCYHRCVCFVSHFSFKSHIS